MELMDKIDEAIKTKVVLDKKEVKKYATEIMKKYNCKKILGMIDEQMLEYVEPGWENDGEYETEYDWYLDYGRGEAESDIIEDVVRKIEKKKKIKFHIDTFIDIGEYIADKCGIPYG